MRQSIGFRLRNPKQTTLAAAATIAIGACLAAASAPTASANVSLRNGNFFIGYTDIVYPGGFEPKIERVYNSKTPFKGIFGWGWGNEYEVYLSVSADGSVVAHEYGGGAENRFSPVGFKKAELDKAVEMIAIEAQKAGAFGNAGDIVKYRAKLAADSTFRNDEWEKFRAQKRVQARKLTSGTQLVSNRFSYQYITKVDGGYLRAFDNGRVERFDDAGKLVKISDKNANYIEITYGKDSKIQKIVDNFNRKMFFSFNSQGLVEKIEGENGKKSEYRYNGLNELVWSKDVDTNAYTYKYDTAKHHNMVEVGYSDKTSMQVSYYDVKQLENVRSVKDRDGSVTDYAYDTANKDHVGIGVKVSGQDGKPISVSKYEYFVKRKGDGEEWTWKMVTDIDGDRTETVYNELGNLPSSIKRGTDETKFEYDSKGHVTRKITPSETTELSYDSKVSKVNRVVRRSKSNPKAAHWSTFQYDEKGNLVAAQNSEKKGVRLFYDANGRIRSMVDQSKRQISFKYNESSKPIEITDPALGTITVAYTNAGEIKKVDSTAGRKIALQVTSAFQNLLEIIRPAGVSLSF